jgi:hypothetical protein
MLRQLPIPMMKTSRRRKRKESGFLLLPAVLLMLFLRKMLYVVACNIGAASDTYPMSMIEPKRKFPDLTGIPKRILKWQDILVDTPNYEEVNKADNTLIIKHRKQ